MTPRSFLADNDRLYLAALDRRFEFWQRRGWKIAVAFSLAMVLCGFWLRSSMMSAAHREATASLSAADMVELEPETGFFFTAKQARIHSLHTLAVLLVLFGVASVLIPFISVLLPLGPIVTLWRTVLLLERKRAGDEMGDYAVECPVERPARYAGSIKGIPLRYSLWGRPLLDSKMRRRAYLSFLTLQKTRRRRVFAMWTVLPITLLLFLAWSLLPVQMAVRMGFDWYAPFVLFVRHYTEPGKYHTVHLMLTDKMWGIPFAWLYLACMWGGAIKGLLAATRPLGKEQANPKLVREMRRLDILLWRQQKSADGHGTRGG